MHEAHVAALEGRVSAHELADVLGVTARTVRSYWRAGTCPRCGGPQIGATASSCAGRARARAAALGPQICATASLCADCIPYVALRRPSKAEIVRALRRWTRDTGAPPRVSDWSEPGGRWEREYPAWPSAGDVRAHFESWPAALAGAACARAAARGRARLGLTLRGLPVRRCRWSASSVSHRGPR